MKTAHWLCAGLAWLVIIEATVSAAAREEMTPAGRAILDDVHKRSEVAIMNAFRKGSETRKQIGLLLRAEHPDWELLRALMAQDYANGMRMRQLSRDVDLQLLERLAEGDRIRYLRDGYPDPKPPVIIVVPKTKPSQHPPAP